METNSGIPPYKTADESQASQPAPEQAKTPKPKKPRPPAVQSVDSPLAVVPSYPQSRPPLEASVFSVGKPSKFNWFLVKDICLRIQNGEVLSKICQDKNMPDHHTVNLWMKKYPKMLQMIERSRTIGADIIAERSMTMFDDPAPMEVLVTKNGEIKRISMSGVQRERYKSQAMQWVASKQNPEKYGDKMQVSGQFDVFNVISNLNTGKLGKKMKQVSNQPESQLG